MLLPKLTLVSELEPRVGRAPGAMFHESSAYLPHPELPKSGNAGLFRGMIDRTSTEVAELTRKCRSRTARRICKISNACANEQANQGLNVMNDQALPDLGLPSDRMLKAEVALRLAAFLLSLPRSGPIASVAIDGPSLKVGNLIVFDIGRFMTETGWEQVKQSQVGQNTWTGTYRRGDKTIRVYSRVG